MLAKVNNVKTNFNMRFFDFFDTCLIKYFDSGDVEFTFYTTTDNAGKVIEWLMYCLTNLERAPLTTCSFRNLEITTKSGL